MIQRGFLALLAALIAGCCGCGGNSSPDAPTLSHLEGTVHVNGEPAKPDSALKPRDLVMVKVSGSCRVTFPDQTRVHLQILDKRPVVLRMPDPMPGATERTLSLGMGTVAVATAAGSQLSYRVEIDSYKIGRAHV